METRLLEQSRQLLYLLGHDEAPFGVHYSDEKPEGYGPKPGEIFSREREEKGQIDWNAAFSNFTCICGSLWLARQKRKAAWISHEACGCMGGGYYAGMYAPFLETNVLYMSTGIPGVFEGGVLHRLARGHADLHGGKRTAAARGPLACSSRWSNSPPRRALWSSSFSRGPRC